MCARRSLTRSFVPSTVPPMSDREEFEQAIREVVARDAITERVTAHWSHLFPRVDDENTLITACLTGLFAPVELGVSRACFTGHRWKLWQAIELSYAAARDFSAPNLETMAEWLTGTGVRGPVLEELTTLCHSQAFQVEEQVLLAAARVREAYRARELAMMLERAAMRLHAGELVDRVLEELHATQV